MGRFIGVAIVVLAFVVACGEDDEGESTRTPTSSATTAAPTPSSQATPSASPTGDVITRGPDIDFPDDMAMIIESGCWGCDGGAGPLWRIYRDSSGNIRQESLTDRPGNGLERVSVAAGGSEHVPVSRHALTADASVMAISLCIKGTCEFSGLSDFDAASEAIAYRSLDGGVTWQELGRGGPVYGVAAVLTNGQVIVYEGDVDDGQVDYSLLPGGTALAAPPGAQYPVTIGETILWAAQDFQLISNDGSPFFRPPDGGQAYYNAAVGQLTPDKGGQALLYWEIPMGPGSRPPGYIDRWIIGQIDVAEAASLSRQWEIDGYMWTIGWWSSKDDKAVISFQAEGDEGTASPFPTLVDFGAGVYNMILDPFTSENPGYSSLGRTAVHAVQTGPFARVTGTGSCLNLRAEPSSSAEILTCVADGVLLRDLEEMRDADGQTWASVMTPGGLQGWASAAFLER